jgi:hypothetical protein
LVEATAALIFYNPALDRAFKQQRGKIAKETDSLFKEI